MTLEDCNPDNVDESVEFADKIHRMVRLSKLDGTVAWVGLTLGVAMCMDSYEDLEETCQAIMDSYAMLEKGEEEDDGR